MKYMYQCLFLYSDECMFVGGYILYDSSSTLVIPATSLATNTVSISLLTVVSHSILFVIMQVFFIKFP